MITAMKTVNQTFDWHRFMAALRKEFVENRTMIMFGVLGMYLLLTIGMITNNITESLNNDLVNCINNYVPHKMGYMALVVTCIVFPSMAFRNLKSKGGRVSQFTLPSSTFEKLLVNITIYVIGFYVMFHVCAQLADFTRIAILLPLRSDRIIVPGSITFMNLVNDTVTGIGTSLVAEMTTALSTNVLSCMAMYLMGSILWPRLSLIKTFIAGQVITLIGAGNIFIAGMYYSYTGPHYSWLFDTFIASRSLWGLSCWYIVETIVFGALAWYLLKHKDVISTKWWK